MNTSRPALSVLLGIALLAPGSLPWAAPAASHGAVFPTPADAPNIPGPGPGDTTPGTPGGGTAPANPAPAGPGPPPRGPASGGASPPPVGPSLPTSAVPLQQQLDLTDWSWWWEFNKEPYLDLKAHLYRRSVVSGSDSSFLGRNADAARQSRRPSQTLVHGTVVPSLVSALEGTKSNDVVSACLIALARIGEDQNVALRQLELEEIIEPYLADPNQEVAETAAAALGILGRENSALVLGELLLDSEAGRRAVGGGRVSLRTQAFAAYALGLLGAQSEKEDVRRYVVHKLARALEEVDAAAPDVAAACVIAIGRVPLRWSGEPPPEKRSKAGLPATASREAQVRYVSELVGDRERHRFVRAHAATAVGRLVAPGEPDEGSTETADALRQEIAGELIDVLEARRREPREVRQSVAMALGSIADNDGDELDARCRKALLALDDDADRPTRHFAWISLARIAARPGAGAPVAVGDVRAFLMSKLARGRNDTARWGALALAVLESDGARRGKNVDTRSTSLMRQRLRDTSSPRDASAFAISLGLTRDIDASSELTDKFTTVEEERARGLVAVALGLVDARTALPAIRAASEDTTYRPRLLRELAIALGLLGDARVVELLASRLEDARSVAAQGSIAQALGRIGDTRSIAPLIALLEDANKTDQARAFAAVALGIVADKDDLPWNAILSIDTNYVAAPTTLYDAQGFGILNIL